MKKCDHGRIDNECNKSGFLVHVRSILVIKIGGAALYFPITIGIGLAMGGKKTCTYLHGRDKRKKLSPDHYLQFDKPEVLFYDDTGVFDVRFGENKILRSCQPRIKIGNTLYTPTQKDESKRLKIVRFTEGIASRTGLGKVSETTLEWTIGATDKRVTAKIYQGEEIPFIQCKLILHFPYEQEGKGKFEKPNIEFPWFINESNNNHILTWANEKFAPPRMEFDFAGAPVVMYDDELNNFVFSSLDDFFVTGISHDKKKHSLSCALAGSVEDTPAEFALESLIVFCKGINKGMESWGELFRKRHAATGGGEIRDPYSSPITAYLGYNTDNGAYYYYNTEKGMNYEETMIALYEHHKEIGLPMGYYELDSWWYPKSLEKIPALLKIFLFGSALHWGEPPKEDIFPHGLKNLWEKMGKTPLMCHSRWFSPESDYVKQYDFHIQEPSLKSFNIPLFAAPKNQDFWDDLFKEAKEWGLSCYLQDWLSYQYDEIDIMKTNHDFADKWTTNMARAAEKQGITLQYCMAPSSFMMQAVKLSNVMQARASDDHHASIVPRRWYQPHFTQTSILCNAIGIWPHKDTFFSTDEKFFGYYRERRPEMECLTAVLSGGPVAPSDKIGHENMELLMKTCRKDGLLLKPDKPATPIDLMFKQHAKYYITLTCNKKAIGKSWHYVHVMNLWPGKVKDKMVTLGDLCVPGNQLAYHYFSKETKVLKSPDDELSFDLGNEEQELVVLCPELLDGIYLIGNHSKFVTCSTKQFPSIEISDTASVVTVQIEDVPGEQVPVLLYYEHEPPKVQGDGIDVVDDAEPNVLHITASMNEEGKNEIKISQ